MFYFAFFHEWKVPSLKTKNQIIQQVAERENMFREHGKLSAHVDSLTHLLIQYNPGVSQTHLESRKTYEFQELQKVSDGHKNDPEYRIIRQLEVFYSMQFFDKQASWHSQKNTEALNKELTKCEIGFERNRDMLFQMNLGNQGKED
jgi:hypothetical protein